MFPKGNRFTFFLLLQKEPKSTRSVLPRQGHAFHVMESSRKGTFFGSFRFYEKNGE